MITSSFIHNERKGKLGVAVEKTNYLGDISPLYCFGLMPNGYQTLCTPQMGLVHMKMLREALDVAIKDAES